MELSVEGSPQMATELAASGEPTDRANMASVRLHVAVSTFPVLPSVSLLSVRLRLDLLQLFRSSIKTVYMGGTVAQPVAPTTFGLDAHGGHRFDSGLMSFVLSSPRLFSLSFPVPLFTKTIDKKPPKKK